MIKALSLLSLLAFGVAGCAATPASLAGSRLASPGEVRRAKCDAASIVSIVNPEKLFMFTRRPVRDAAFAGFALKDLAELVGRGSGVEDSVKARAVGVLAAEDDPDASCGRIYQLYLADGGTKVALGRVKVNVHIDAIIHRRVTAYLDVRRERVRRDHGVSYDTRVDLQAIRAH